MRLRLTLSSAFLTTMLIGQGVVPPFQLGQINPLPGLSPGGVPALDVRQVNFVHLPGDPPNVFYCSLTVRGLSSTIYNGDLLCGSYDVLTDTFTPNTDAAGLNTGAPERGLIVHHTGLLATYNRDSPFSGIAWLASRPALGQPWQIVGQIPPGPPQPLYNPVLATWRGLTVLLHDHGQNIALRVIDVTTAQLIGDPLVIVRSASTYSHAWNATPVTDPNGELIGVSHFDRSNWTAESDHYMSLDLDAGTPSVLMNDTTGSTSQGAFIGGRFFDADFTTSPYHIFAIDTVWFTGGRAPVGGTMHVRTFSPPTSGSQLYLSLIAVSSAWSPVGVPFPPLQGLLGINPVGAWASDLILHDNSNGEGQFSFVVPNVMSLRNTRLRAQSATWETVSGSIYLGNTAQLLVDW